MDQLPLKGKILIVFSDPGGAKPLLALVEQRNWSEVYVVSDRTYPFYSDFKTKVEVISASQVQEVFHRIQPDTLLTGTSYTSDIEKRFISIARENRVTSCSFIDHWTSMRKRFEDIHGNLIMPDRIGVIDERAKHIAIAEGIPEELLVAIGNPYHEWLKEWEPTLSKAEWMKSIGLNEPEKKVLLFAPDPLSNVNGWAKFGFDELTATQELNHLLNQDKDFMNQWVCLIKPHPNQNMAKLRESNTTPEVFRILPENAHTNTAIYYSDAVLGFFSSFLIEANLMHKPVVRFLPETVTGDPLSELNIGLTASRLTLLNAMKGITNGTR